MANLPHRNSVDHLPPYIASLLAETLHTNYVPADDEIAEIRKLLTKPTRKIHSIDREICQMQVKLDNHIRRKERLNKDIQTLRRLLSPTYRLIPEILQEIFYHCLPTARNAVMSRTEAPLLLGRVCRQWRLLVFSTPQLWTSIHIVIPLLYNPGPDLETTLRRQAISAWLSRSGALPLSISIHSSTSWIPDVTIPVNTKVQPYLDLISPFALRWKSLHLMIHGFDWTDFFNRYHGSDLPLLEKLHISGTLFRNASDVLGSVSAPLDLTSPAGENSILLAPQLRVLSMPMYRARILQFPIRWSGLTGLDLTSFGYQDVLKALALCPNLELCSLFVPCAAEAGFIEPTKLLLPKLHTLQVTDRSDATGYAHRLFESLYAPELCHLSYRRIFAWTMNIADGSGRSQERLDQKRLIDALALFFGRLILPLRELDLDAGPLLDDHAEQILHLLPGLRRLSLTSLGAPMDVFPTAIPPGFLFEDKQLIMLTPGNTPKLGGARGLPGTSGDIVDTHTTPESCLCPELEVFRCTGAMFSEIRMMDFLRFRSMNHQVFRVAHLKRASISFVRGRSGLEGVMSQIQELQSATGMIIDINYEVLQGPLIRRELCSPYDGLNLLATEMSYGVVKSPTYFGF